MFGGIILGCIQLVEVGLTKYQMKKEMEMMHKMQEEELDRQKEYIREMRPGFCLLDLDLFGGENRKKK